MKELKTKYKFIHFVENTQDRREITKFIYECRNNKSGEILAYIHFYNQWQQYVFTQANSGVVFNNQCLLDIIDFINQLN